MNTSDRPRNALSICALAAILTGCGASQSTTGAPSSQFVPNANAAAKHSTGTLSYKVLHNFGNGSDAQGPATTPTVVNGMLYGTAGGGKHAGGAVYSSTTSGSETVLYSFKSNKDNSPAGRLLDVNGTLYGAAYQGPGFWGSGGIFSLTTSGEQREIYAFGGSPDGAYPDAGLVNVKGTLYGTTGSGGTNNDGTVFSVTPTGKETVLHSFGNSGDGLGPEASLVELNGKLYGTTNLGGASNAGTVFSITPSGKETVLHSFAGSPHDGGYPAAALINVGGVLYGTTQGGGANCYSQSSGGCGTVYSITASGKETVLHSFGRARDGRNPSAELLNVKGTLYGTTCSGGDNKLGTIFSITTSGAETVVYSLESVKKDGFCPSSGLVDFNGTLYGTTAFGGEYAAGGSPPDPGGTLFAVSW